MRRLWPLEFPPNALGYYLTSTTLGFVPGAFGSHGVLCLGGDIGGFGVFQASVARASSGVVDTSQLAQPMGPVPAMAGDLWHFQSWYRDANAGAATSNFTNGVTILFQ